MARKSLVFRILREQMVHRRDISVICQWIIVVTAFFLMLITVVFLAWTSDRGFDITDEGFYLLAGQFPEEFLAHSTSFYIYSGVIQRQLKNDVVWFRLMGLFFILVSSVSLYIGCLKLLSFRHRAWREDLRVKICAFVFVLSGGLLYYTWFLRTPSYNLWNAFCLTGSCGSLFIGLGRIRFPGSFLGSGLWFLLVGLLVGLSLMIKWPTGVLLSVLYSLCLALWPGISVRQRLTSVTLMLSGIIVWLGVYFLLIEPFRVWSKAMRDAFETAQLLGGGQDVSSIMRYLDECKYLARRSIRHFWPFHVALFIGFGVRHVLRRRIREGSWWLSALIVSVFVLAGWKAYTLQYHLGGMDQGHIVGVMVFYVTWVFLLLSTAGLSLWFVREKRMGRNSNDHGSLILASFVLGTLPLAGAIGTGNPIFYNTVLNMGPWFGLLLILLFVTSQLHQSKTILLVGILTILTFATSQVVSAGVFAPYRLRTALWAQTQATEIGHPRTILKLDSEARDFFNRIREMAHEHGFKPGDDVLGFFDLPGVVFALGGRSPGSPWYLGCGYKGARAYAEKILSLVPPERLKRAFILETSDSAKCLPDLAKLGVNFPGDYILCGELMIPYPWTKETVRLWKPRFI
jgi:hypothetical protein